MDPAIGEVRNCDVLIEDGRIVDVGPALRSDGADIIEARDRLVLPGLINAHLHLWQTGLRGIAGNWISAEYHQVIHGNIATRYTPEDSYLGPSWARSLRSTPARPVCSIGATTT